MNGIMKKLTALLEVRKLMALASIALFCTLALMGNLEPTFIEMVLISIFSFYFGKTSTINEKGDDKQ